MGWLPRLELNCIFSGIWLSVAYSLYFIPPDSIRTSRQGGGPTNSALVLEKGSERQWPFPGGERQREGEMAEAGACTGFPNQGRNSRRAQDQEFGGGKSAEARTSIRLGQENPLADSRIPSPQAISSYQSLKGQQRQHTTEYQWPKGSNFRLSRQPELTS